LITEQLLAELRRTPGWRVVPSGQGKYVLRGIVRSFTADPQLISKEHLAVENRATLVLEIRLFERQSGQVLWGDTALRAFEDYPIGQDILASERNKLAAIERISEILASRVRVRLQDTW
jgi:hypothetical protein